MKQNLGLSALGLLAAALLCGCGPAGPETAQVSGTVTLDDKPLSGATVLFTTIKGGRPAGGGTDEEGNYELTFSRSQEGATPGKYTVEITTYRDGDPVEQIEAVPEKIPAKYNIQSELTATVEPAKANDIDFDLTSDGQVIQPSLMQ